MATHFRSSILFFLFLSGTLIFPLFAATPPDDSCIVFPSPASGDSVQVSYTMPSPGRASVLIYNESGDLVAESQEVWPAGVQKTVLNLFYFRKGLYLCQVHLDLGANGLRVLKPFKFTVIR